MLLYIERIYTYIDKVVLKANYNTKQKLLTVEYKESAAELAYTLTLLSDVSGWRIILKTFGVGFFFTSLAPLEPIL